MPIKPSLLVADDEIEIGKIVKTVAEDLGFEVTCVSEGSQVVSLVERNQPDVIALDLRMPGSDGVEIIRELGKKQCQSGILLMSGMDQRMLTSVQSLGKENNLDIGSTLTKPMSIDAIASALNPYLSKTKEIKAKNESVPILFEYGLSLQYEPEFQLLEPSEERRPQRLRVHPRWHMDDDSENSGASLNALASEFGISKGLSKLTLLHSLQNVKAWNTRGFDPEIAVQLSDIFLTDLATPDSLAIMVDKLDVPHEKVAIEINENSVTNKPESVSDVLSRLRIKGFRIDVVVKGEGGSILPLIDNLPIDQIVVDMSQLSKKDNFLNNMELEFSYSSLTSIMAKKGIITCASNVDSSQIFEFVRKCKFNAVRGLHILAPSKAIAILPLYQEGKFSLNS